MKKILFLLSFFALSVSAMAQVDVLHYDINLNVDNQISKHHIGYTDIKMLALENGNMVALMLKNHNVDSIVNMNNGSLIMYDYDNLNLNLNLSYTAGDTLNIRIYYNGGQVVERWGGIHYDANLIYTIGVAFEDYPHSYARSWFPVKEVFDDKATYNLNISVSNDKQARCTGMLDSLTNASDFTTYHYSVSQEIAPYLVSMTIADFYEYSSTIHSVYGDIPLTVHYLNPSTSNIIEEMFDRVPLAFDTLEKSFGRFAFNKVGYCVTPIGSMEHVDNISLASGAVTGEINGMSNVIHELAHSWFGNNITCKTARDMWINEGWTSFTTRLSLSKIYGEQAARDFFRAKHEQVLTDVIRTEGYFPVAEPDSTQTYSSTVYDKGAEIALSLKEYIGDEDFFAAVRDMIDSFHFSNLTSEMLRDYLSERTGIDLTSFFDCMVFSASTPHYEITHKEFLGRDAIITIKQRAYPDSTKTIATSRIPVTFFDDEYHSIKNYVIFNGSEATLHIDNLPFEPTNAMIDYDEEFMDLTTDYAQMIKTSDTTYIFPNTYFRLKTDNINDSSLVRATLHWIGQEEQQLPQGVNRLSNQHYWTIEGLNMNSENMHGLFRYEVASYSSAFDTTLAQEYTQRDSLILLYRRDKNSAWTHIPCSPITSNKGYMKTNFLFEGEYTMAMGDINAVGLNDINTNPVKVYPNPTNNICNVECKYSTDAILYNIDGKLLKQYKFKKGINSLNLSEFKDKTFIIKLYNKKTDSYSSKILFKK